MPIYSVLDNFDPSSWRFSGSVVLVVLLAGMSFALRKRLPALAAGGACYFFLLLPFLGLTNFPHFPVDRYTYLPLLAWTTLIGGGVYWLWRSPVRASRIFTKPVVCLCLLAAIVLGVAARRQTAVWQNSVVLYEHILSLLGDSPRRAAMLRRLGTSLDMAGRHEEAVERFTESLVLNPQDVDAYLGLGLTYAHLGRWVESARADEQAYRLAPDDWQVNFNFGTALVEAGEVERGIRHFLRAIQLYPAAGEAYLNLANVLAERGQYVQAARVLADGLLKTGGDWTVACRLAWMMAACPDPRVRNGAEALKLSKAINERTGGTHPVVLDGLAVAYAEVGRFIEAVDVARQALERAEEAGEEELAAEIRRRMALYEAGRPYRDDVRASRQTGGGAMN
jgi:tetratricopeptide (TPR) repeat protein